MESSSSLPCTGEACRSVLEALEETQTVFGDLNEVTTVRAVLTGPEAPNTGDPAARRAIAWMIGANHARADFGWAGAKDLQRSLEETPPFWK